MNILTLSCALGLGLTPVPWLENYMQARFEIQADQFSHTDVSDSYISGFVDANKSTKDTETRTTLQAQLNSDQPYTKGLNKDGHCGDGRDKACGDPANPVPKPTKVKCTGGKEPPDCENDTR